MNQTYNNDEAVAALRMLYTETPTMRRLTELIVEYAEAKGGIDLEVIKRGWVAPFWGSMEIMTVDQRATLLGIPEPRVIAIEDAMLSDILPTLRAWKGFDPADFACPPNI